MKDASGKRNLQLNRKICSEEKSFHSLIRLLLNIAFSLLTVLLSANLTYSLNNKQSYSYEDNLLTCINIYRAENELKPLLMESNLKILAKSQSQYMHKKNALNHDHFDERFSKSGRSLCVENVGWNYQTPEAQVQAWKKSGGHNKNLLNKKIKYAGIAKSGLYVTFFACE
jgi:uncharacterized protein YkwD